MIMTGPKFHSSRQRPAMTIIGPTVIRISAGMTRDEENICGHYRPEADVG
jgi:hypothetical protein